VFDQGAEESQITRRPIIRRSLIGAMGLLVLTPVILLRDLGPLPKGAPSHTIWAKGIRIVSDVTYVPVKASDLQLGSIVNAVPENLTKLEGKDFLDAKAKAAVIIVRMLPGDIKAFPNRVNWGVHTSAVPSTYGNRRRASCCARVISPRSTLPTTARCCSDRLPVTSHSCRSWWTRAASSALTVRTSSHAPWSRTSCSSIAMLSPPSAPA